MSHLLTLLGKGKKIDFCVNVHYERSISVADVYVERTRVSLSWVHTTTFRPTFGHTSSSACKSCLKFIRVDVRWRMLTNVVFVENF